MLNKWKKKLLGIPSGIALELNKSNTFVSHNMFSLIFGAQRSLVAVLVCNLTNADGSQVRDVDLIKLNMLQNFSVMCI